MASSNLPLGDAARCGLAEFWHHLPPPDANIVISAAPGSHEIGITRGRGPIRPTDARLYRLRKSLLMICVFQQARSQTGGRHAGSQFAQVSGLLSIDLQELRVAGWPDAAMSKRHGRQSVT